MSLTVGTGPFAKEPLGRFNFEVEPPTGSVLFFDPVPQRIRAVFAKETVVDSRRARLLHETGHLPVYYFPDEDVRFDLLEPSDKRTGCAYKGFARYWSLQLLDGHVEQDVVWSYPEPRREGEPVAGMLCFFNEHVDIEVDGELQERPATQWSRREL
jgi:uncharacterized protein (DUF427 family)